MRDEDIYAARYTGVEERHIEEEKAEKVQAREKGSGSGQGREYIRVVFMSSGPVVQQRHYRGMV